DLALSPDGAHLWVARLDRGQVVQVDTATGEALAAVDTDQIMAWQLAWVPGTDGDSLWASDLEGETVAVIDPAQGVLVRSIPLPTSPAGLAVAPDGGTVWAAVSGSDVVVALDPATGDVTDTVAVAEADLVDASGAPRANSNVNALAFDAETGRLYASRGADNAVSVLSTDPLAVLGALPTAWYPTALALDTRAGLLVVVEGKGGGVGPSEGQGAKQRFQGSVTRVDLAAVDLAQATAQVSANFQRPRAAWGADPCPDQFFPVPTRAGERSPIEHVVLIVKENKTFDCVFGDLGDPRAAADPAYVRWGEAITPNQHALARAFALGDNFYTDTPNSDSGHSMLTGVHLTEFAERMWIEDVRSGDFSDFPVSAATVPDVGNLFTHLVDHGVSLTIYGEIVGTFATAANGERMIQYSDTRYPGGPFTNYGVTDEAKAAYVIEKL
ncbi:MAG: hypothetical protein KC613_02765, partial [Myxococcales bacterium]|nr:hypothetical protein [Myxococcales bacterium]